MSLSILILGAIVAIAAAAVFLAEFAAIARGLNALERSRRDRPAISKAEPLSHPSAYTPGDSRRAAGKPSPLSTNEAAR